MSMLFNEEDQNGIANASDHADSDDDQSSIGSQDFTDNQGFQTLTIAPGHERFGERMDDYLSPLSPVVPTIRDPAARKFDEFISSTKRLEALFKKCGYTVQRLGSALQLSKSSLDFYRALRRVRIHFQENSEALTGISHTRERPISLDQLARYRGSMPSMSNESTALFDTEEDAGLPEYLNILYVVLGNFIDAIVEFNDYYADEEGGEALHNFRREIRLLHESLLYFGKDENTKELQRYVLSLAISLRKHIDEMSAAMTRFIENGIPCISFAQKRFAKLLANATAIATFFSGVAATTLQYSFNTPRSSIDNATNTLWFAALVLSIGSAVNGLLTMTWRQAIYSSPSRSISFPVRFWMRHGYLSLLAAAVLAYCSGLITYVFSQQSRSTAWVVLALLVFCDLGALILVGRYGWEKWNFISLQNRKYMNIQHAKSWFRRKLYDVQRRGADATHQDNSINRYSASDNGASGLTPRDDDNTKAKLRARLPRHRTRRGSHLEEYGPSSLQDTLVTNPTNLKEQEVAITKLIPLEVVGKEAIHMQFSPSGHWFVACYKKTIRVYEVERFRLHQEITHRGGNAKQIQWDAQGNRFLTRLKHSVNVWELKENSFVLTKTFKLPDLCLIQWLNYNEFLALTDLGDTLWRVNVAEDRRKFYNLPRDLQIRDMCAVSRETEYDRVIFVASRPLGLPGDVPKGIDCIIVFSLDDSFADEKPLLNTQSKKSSANRRIEKRIPLTDHVMNLSVCRDRHHMLVSYETKPPEAWVLGEELRTLSMRQVLPLPTSENKEEPVRKHVQWGEPFFLGEVQNIVACGAKGEMHFWRLDEHQHFLPFHRLLFAGVGEQIGGQPIYCFNKALLGNAVMATATAAGALKIWGTRAATRSPSDLTTNHRTPSSPSSLGVTPERAAH